MIMNRLADGIEMVIHGQVIIECDASSVDVMLTRLYDVYVYDSVCSVNVV